MADFRSIIAPHENNPGARIVQTSTGERRSNMLSGDSDVARAKEPSLVREPLLTHASYLWSAGTVVHLREQMLDSRGNKNKTITIKVIPNRRGPSTALRPRAEVRIGATD